MAKVIATGDWHFGRDNDSRRHNDYLMEFIEEMVEYANANGIDAIFQVGDYFDNRSKMSIETLNYGIRGAHYIKENFNGNFYVLSGNHDMYFKNRLDVTSTNALKGQVSVINGIQNMVIDGSKVTIAPWVCSPEDWEQLIKLSEEGDYVFGHFEFKNFMMNENYMMEHGFSHRELRGFKRVVTGHYHKRQEKDNVIYVGSPFPFDYNDANDLDRGFTVIDLDTNEIEHVNWNKVKILSVDYEEFLELKEEGYIDEHTSIRINLPDDANDETIERASEEISGMQTNASKLNYKGNKAKELMESTVEIKEVKNVDTTIVDSIKGITEPPSDVNVDTLVNVYEEVLERSTSNEH